MADEDMPGWARTLRDFIMGAMNRETLSTSGVDVNGRVVSAAMGISETGYSATEEEENQRAHICGFSRSRLGEGYVLGAEVQPGQEEAATKWDCSELVESSYRMAGLKIPDGAQYQYDFCRPVKFPKPGDLGFLWSDKRAMIGHVFIYSGCGTVIHAVAGRGVVEDPVGNWDHHHRFRGWRRHPDFARPEADRA